MNQLDYKTLEGIYTFISIKENRISDFESNYHGHLEKFVIFIMLATR